MHGGVLLHEQFNRLIMLFETSNQTPQLSLLFIQFFSLGFLTNQNKRNYEETYKTNIAILNEIKKKGGV